MKNLFFLLLLISPSIFSQNFLPCLQQSPYKSNWEFVGPMNNENEIVNQHFGALSCVSVNPNDSNEIYVGAFTSGLFQTLNRGKTWKCLTDSYDIAVCGVNDLIIDYSKNPRRITLATGSNTNWFNVANVGILFSDNGGQTWESRLPIGITDFIFSEINKIKISSDSSLWIAYADKSIIRSMDQGETWSVIFSTDLFPNYYKYNDYRITSLEIFDHGKHVYFTTSTSTLYDESNTNIIRECDLIELTNVLGSNPQPKKLTSQLKEVYNLPKDKTTKQLKISRIPNDEDECIINRTYNNSSEHTLYYFNGNNLKFDAKAIIPNNRIFYEDILWRHGLKVNGKNSAIQYFAGNVFYKSIDSGKTFTQLYDYSFGENNVPHADIRNFIISKSTQDGEGDHIYLCTDGGLSFSSDGGKTFKNLNGESLPITQFYGLGSSPFSGIISAGAQDNSIMSYIPQEKKWIVKIVGDGYDVEYSKLIPGVAFGQYNYFTISKTINDIAPFTLGINSIAGNGAVNKKTLATTKNGTLYFADFSFNKLNPYTHIWKRTNNKPFVDQALAIGLCEADSNIIYVSAMWKGLFKSTDGGETFTDISKNIIVNGTFCGDNRIHGLCVSPTDPDKIWISLGYLGNYQNPCNKSYRALYSPDGGLTWIDISEGLPVYYLTDIVYLDGSNDAVFGSSQEGIFFKENLTSPWKLYSTNFPKCIVTELNINYCRGKIIASTYGRGLWECDLPNIRYTNPLVIKKKTRWETKNEKEALYFTRDIILKKKASLEIACEVHIAKGKTVKTSKASQIKYVGKGKLINNCGEKFTIK